MNYISIMASEKMNPPNSLLTNSASYPIVCLIGSNLFASDKGASLCAAFNYGKLHLFSIVSIRNKTSKKGHDEEEYVLPLAREDAVPAGEMRDSPGS